MPTENGLLNEKGWQALGMVKVAYATRQSADKALQHLVAHPALRIVVHSTNAGTGSNGGPMPPHVPSCLDLPAYQTYPNCTSSLGSAAGIC